MERCRVNKNMAYFYIFFWCLKMFLPRYTNSNSLQLKDYKYPVEKSNFKRCKKFFEFVCFYSKIYLISYPQAWNYKTDVSISYILGRNGPIWVRCVIIIFPFPVTSYVTSYVISYVTNMDISDSCHISCRILKYLGGAGMKFLVVLAGLTVRCNLGSYSKKNTLKR